MSLTLKLPEITNNMFRESDVSIDYKSINEKTNSILKILENTSVAEATIILQLLLRETYCQLVTGIDSNDCSSISSIKKPIDISGIKSSRYNPDGYV